MSASYPTVLQTVLDCREPRLLGDFYRDLLGWTYRPGDETPSEGEDWLVLRAPAGVHGLAFQLNAEYVPPAWTPGPDRRGDQQMMLHLDMGVPDPDSLEQQRLRVLELGGAVLFDRSDDADEPLYVFADPAGHPFCIFVATV
ncbi:VOC family protein [Nocardioides caricicola]|uniref:VOC family protein n=1 Tax=Nocardioides caricicola TaxID=634770 RepID=A0ABW0N1E4_9ACTN